MNTGLTIKAREGDVINSLIFNLKNPNKLEFYNPLLPYNFYNSVSTKKTIVVFQKY